MTASTDPIAEEKVEVAANTAADTEKLEKLLAKTEAPKAGVEDESKIKNFKSVADIQERAPKFFRSMLQMYAQHICREMRKGQEHIKQIMREARKR